MTDEQLRAVYALARNGLTAMNIQPSRVTWVRSEEARERLLRHMAEGNRARTAAAPAVAVLSYDVDWHERLPAVLPPAAAGQELFAGNAQLRAQMGRDNAHLQAGCFVLAVRALGLAAGPMGGSDSTGADADFSAGTARRSMLVATIGAPAAPRHERLPRLGFGAATASVRRTPGDRGRTTRRPGTQARGTRPGVDRAPGHLPGTALVDARTSTPERTRGPTARETGYWGE